MRARLGLTYAGIKCELREVVLRDKPQEMITLSPKATVPVLQLPDGQVIDESYDIITWAISQNDPDNWQDFLKQTDELVALNDGVFKAALDKYKYASRFPEHPADHYRTQGETFLSTLDSLLEKQAFLLGQSQTIADIAIFPFIRQFAHVDLDWFKSTRYSSLQRWLSHYLESPLFKSIMMKYPKWQTGQEPLYFPDLHQ